MKRATSRKKFTAKLRVFKEWLKIARTTKTKELWEIAKAKLRGRCAYYGLTDNLPGIKRFGEDGGWIGKILAPRINGATVTGELQDE